MNLIEIFKPGRHTAMNGRVIEFAEEDLRITINAYDPAIHEAPLVVGHPRADAPAYGWVKGLTFAENSVMAEPDQVDAAFAEMVNAGRFKKVSASFYLPEAPGNPVPGVYYLRHVGFLGAQPPAVKGLKAASFADGEEGVIEFGDWADRVEAGLFRSLRDWILAKFGKEDADSALPGWDVDTVQTEAAQPEIREEIDSGDIAPAYSEKEIMPMLTPEQIAAKEAEFAERETALGQQEAAARHIAHVSFAEGLVVEGKLLPAQKERCIAILDVAAGNGDAVIEFGEGDGKESKPLADSFKEFLSSQPKIVEFAEFAGAETEDNAVVNFEAAPGYTVDLAGLEVHNKALTFQAKNPGMEYMTAVKAIT